MPKRVDRNNGDGSPGRSSDTPPRRVFDASFKLAVVRHALSLPEGARHKPIARLYPGLTPVSPRAARAHAQRPRDTHTLSLGL